jgi:hypothetical protein
MISSKRAYDIVYLALREIGVVALGDSIAADVAQEALLILNSIRAGYGLGNKNNELFDATFTAPDNRINITLGTDGVTAGDIPERPARITGVVVIQGAIDTAINIPVAIRPYSEFRKLSLQNVVAIPNTAYIDTGYPYQRIWFAPGLSSGYSVRVQGLKYLDEYDAIDDQYSDPAEYFAVLYLDLALRLAPKYGVDLGPGVYAQLKSALTPIKRGNFIARLTDMPNGLKSGGSGVNFFSGIRN